METVSATEARADLSKLLDRVVEGKKVTIARRGRPVAVVLRPDELRHLRTAWVFREAEALRARMDAAGRRPLSEMSGISAERADELVAQIRADRDAEIDVIYPTDLPAFDG